MNQLPGATLKQRRGASNKENTSSNRQRKRKQTGEKQEQEQELLARCRQQQRRRKKQQQKLHKKKPLAPRIPTARKIDASFKKSPTSVACVEEALLAVVRSSPEIQCTAEAETAFSLTALASTTAAVGGSGAICTGLVASHGALAFDLCTGGSVSLILGLIGAAYCLKSDAPIEMDGLAGSTEDEQAGDLPLC